MKTIKIIVVTQEDAFFLPNVIENIISKPFVKVQRLIVINSQGALENNKYYFISNFGLKSSMRMIFKYLNSKILNCIDALFFYLLLNRKRSIKAIGKKYKIPYLTINSVNSDAMIDLFKKEKPDLIVSFSAPEVFKKNILAIPTFGVINLHGSYLPDYRGIMPSFWVLANGEKYSGSTVHRMAKRIDEGEILKQERVDISNCRSMYEVIGMTKAIGGKLVTDIVEEFSLNPDSVSYIENKPGEGRYFGWPTKDDIKLFYDGGFRLA